MKWLLLRSKHEIASRDSLWEGGPMVFETTRLEVTQLPFEAISCSVIIPAVV